MPLGKAGIIKELSETKLGLKNAAYFYAKIVRVPNLLYTPPTLIYRLFYKDIISQYMTCLLSFGFVRYIYYEEGILGNEV